MRKLFILGIVSSASMEQINYLEPVLNDAEKGLKGVYFNGKPVINSARLIKYGMTRAATMNSFFNFVKKSRDILTINGFSFELFPH